MLDFKIDFTGSRLQDGITRKEATSVINNNLNVKLYPGWKKTFLIGYSESKRIIIIAFDYKTKKGDIRILNSKLPDENYIKEFYCKG